MFLPSTARIADAMLVNVELACECALATTVLSTALIVSALFYVWVTYLGSDRVFLHAPLKGVLRHLVNWLLEKDVGLDYELSTWDMRARRLTIRSIVIPSESYLIDELQLTLSLRRVSLTIHGFKIQNPPPPPGYEAWTHPNLLSVGMTTPLESFPLLRSRWRPSLRALMLAHRLS